MNILEILTGVNPQESGDKGKRTKEIAHVISTIAADGNISGKQDFHLAHFKLTRKLMNDKKFAEAIDTVVDTVLWFVS